MTFGHWEGYWNSEICSAWRDNSITIVCSMSSPSFLVPFATLLSQWLKTYLFHSLQCARYYVVDATGRGGHYTKLALQSIHWSVKRHWASDRASNQQPNNHTIGTPHLGALKCLLCRWIQHDFHPLMKVISAKLCWTSLHNLFMVYSTSPPLGFFVVSLYILITFLRHCFNKLIARPYAMFNQ